MTSPMKNVKLTTCRVVATRGLKQCLRALVTEDNIDNAADIVVGRCEDCGALLYADDILADKPEPVYTPEPVDEWEYFL